MQSKHTSWSYSLDSIAGTAGGGYMMDSYEKYGLTREEVEEMFEFVSSVNQACKKGENVFVCPKCGAGVEVHTVKYNGHRHARCGKCGIAFME